MKNYFTFTFMYNEFHGFRYLVARRIFLFNPFKNELLFIDAAGTVAQIGQSLKSNNKRQI
jgi:hypothetical protein